MRLTLRTMLAYRDRVLRPADTEDLHRRIQSSEDAGNLLRRIDSLGKKQFTPSPTIVGKGLAGDPNSYAEYLDDVLAAEKVPEFEKTCLESDVHLNELAECHSLLSSAIHTRVRVPDNLHEQSLAIGDKSRRQKIRDELRDKRRNQGNGRILRADAAHPAQTPQGQDKGLSEEQIVCVQAPMVASGGSTIREKGLNLENSKLTHEVPEYLVGKNKGSWRIPVVIGILLAALGLLVWQSLGPWDKIRGLFANESAAEKETVAAAPESRDTKSETAKTETEEQSATNTSIGANTSNTESDLPSGTEDSVQTSPNTTDSQTETPQSAEEPSNESLPTEDSVSNELLKPANAVAAWLPTDDAEAQAVVLMREGQGASRVAAGQALAPDTELIIPPFYYTTIDMPGGTRWETAGPSFLKLGNNTSAHVESSLCRAMLRAGPNGDALSISTPVGKSVIRLSKGGAIAAIEVTYRARTHGPVTDSNATVPMLIVVCGDGVVSCEYEAKSYALQTGTGLAIIDGEKPREFTLLNIPAWFRKNNMRPVDKLAREDFARRLDGIDQTTVLKTIADLAVSNQPYLASIASQTSMLLGNWQPFAAHTLDDGRQSSYWRQSIELARQLAAADASTAKLLTQALDAVHPGSNRQQLLLGAPTDTFKDKTALGLMVESLAAEKLGERVLAINQLQRTTGLRMNYLPHQPSRTSLQKWRLEHSKNRLEIKAPPDLIWERIAP